MADAALSCRRLDGGSGWADGKQAPEAHVRLRVYDVQFRGAKLLNGVLGGGGGACRPVSQH